MALATNFKDDVLADSEQRRRYRIIENDDGTISFEDVTEYSQTGSKFGALEVNQERQAINELDENKINYSDIINTLGSTATNRPLSAAQGKSLSDRVGALSSLTTSVKTSIVNAINSLMNGKVNFTDIVNNLTTTAANKALDARQGKALNDKIAAINSALTVSSAAVTSGTDITVYNNVKHVAKYGKIVILQIMFSNKYVVNQSRELWVCTVPSAYRPAGDFRTNLIAGAGINCTVVAQQRDGGVNLTPNTANLPANSGMVIFMVWTTT